MLSTKSNVDVFEEVVEQVVEELVEEEGRWMGMLELVGEWVIAATDDSFLVWKKMGSEWGVGWGEWIRCWMTSPSWLAMFRLRVELRWTRLITKDDGPCLASLNCSNLSLKESTLWPAQVGVLGLFLFPGLNILSIL